LLQNTKGFSESSKIRTKEAERHMTNNCHVEAVFYGDNALNLTEMANLPNGTEYAVCTTLQYFGYKPASNTAILTVEPQSTQVMTQTKTPEQLQQEAEDSGWLST
jgi:hypothetical protein